MVLRFRGVCPPVCCAHLRFERKPAGFIASGSKEGKLPRGPKVLILLCQVSSCLQGRSRFPVRKKERKKERTNKLALSVPTGKGR